MAWTIANEVKKAALDGITALFNSGQIRLLTAGSSELAMPTFGATAFGAATTASPSVATANTMTADATITAGTIGLIDFRTSGGASRISGSVGVGTGDFQVSDNVIPGTATSVNLSSLTFSLQIT
jgi:hypothetical protein